MTKLRTPCCPYCHLPTNQLSPTLNLTGFEDDMGYHEWWTCKCGNSFEDDETVLCSYRDEDHVVSHRIIRWPSKNLVAQLRPAHCECGHYAYPIQSSNKFIGYYCMEHGFLTHDAIIYDKEKQ